MKNLTSFVIGAAVGAVVGLTVHYLLGPSGSANDGNQNKNGVPYRSRLDAALDAGRQAAYQREAELKASFEQAKRIS